MATLARIDPDAALETFVSAFQRRHFQLDESVFDQGFEFWAEESANFIPILMRGTDRCNGIEPLGYRPGLALQWALIQDVFYGGERSEVTAEAAEASGPELGTWLSRYSRRSTRFSASAWRDLRTAGSWRSAGGRSATSFSTP